MVVAIIVQARMGSSRLPGKVLERLNDRTVIAEVLRRCQSIPGADVVCCAIPQGADDDPLAAEIERAGAIVFRGHESDVLDRYARAAEAVAADVVMRVTGDKPLIDPVICGKVLELRDAADADFSCNNMPAGWPHGIDCEAFTFDVLARAASRARDAEDREHVTPWIRRQTDIKRVNLDGPGGGNVDLRWTLDYPEDLAFFTALFDTVPSEIDMPLYQDIMRILEKRPDIAALNARWRHLSRYSASSEEAAP